MMSDKQYREIPQKIDREFKERRKLSSEIDQRLLRLESKIGAQSDDAQELIRLCNSINKFQHSLELTLQLHEGLIIGSILKIFDILKGNQEVHEQSVGVFKTIKKYFGMFKQNNLN